LTKSELTDRLKRRARDRYGLEIDAPWLDDFIKDKFFPWTSRDKNKGQCPKAQYDRRVYRRALQLVRFRSVGIVDRDALLVQLFLRGYSLAAGKRVKRAVLKEYVKYGKHVLHQLRSTYADNKRSIPTKHKASLLRQIGSEDQRLRAGGFWLSSDEIIEAIRVAKQDIVNPDIANNIARTFVVAFHKQPTFQNLAPLLIKLLAGTLMFGRDPADKSAQMDSIENIITESDNATYSAARRLFCKLMHGGLDKTFRVVGTNAAPERREEAIGLTTAAVQNSPAWTCVGFVACLLVETMINNIRGK
jgi:hypothetical protein